MKIEATILFDIKDEDDTLSDFGVGEELFPEKTISCWLKCSVIECETNPDFCSQAGNEKYTCPGHSINDVQLIRVKKLKKEG